VQEFSHAQRSRQIPLDFTGVMETNTTRRFSALFFLLLAYLVLYPYAQNRGFPYLAFRVFGTV
jgi:hypothetical protein